MQFYVPPLPVPDSEHAGHWHPEDALFAPLLDADGSLVGVISVDDPVDGHLPGEEQRSLLETFAVQAALAIDHARVHEAVREREDLLGRLFDESPIGKALFGADGCYVRVNRAYCTFMGRERRTSSAVASSTSHIPTRSRAPSPCPTRSATSRPAA